MNVFGLISQLIGIETLRLTKSFFFFLITIGSFYNTYFLFIIIIFWYKVTFNDDNLTYDNNYIKVDGTYHYMLSILIFFFFKYIKKLDSNNIIYDDNNIIFNGNNY